MIFRSTSKRPILIVGNGARLSGAVEVLHRFASKTRIPVLTTMNAVDLVQDEAKLGFIGVYGNRIANMIVKNSDLVIAIGARLGLRQIGNIKEYFAPDAKLIRVDIDEYELSRTIKDDEERHLSDAKRFIEILMSEDIPDYSQWNRRCFEAKDILEVYDKEVGNLWVEKISSLLPDDPIITVDVGQNLCWCAQSLTLKGQKGRILIGGSYGSMGCSLPYAVGASIAAKNGTVFCITGDGGLQMNIQELETVVSEKLPVKILVLDNKVLGKISEIQEGYYGKRYAQTTADSGYSVPDFSKIAQAYGIKSVQIENYEQLDDYSDWLQDKDPCLIDILLPENTKLIPKVFWNSEEIRPLIDKDVEMRVNEILSGDNGASK